MRRRGSFGVHLFFVALSLLPLVPVRCTRGAAEEGPPWQWDRALVPKALLVEGLWTDVFRLREACHTAGIPYHGAYKSRSPYFRPKDRLYGMPAKADEYSRFGVIVLSNIDAVTLGPGRMALIERFVENGGGLVVLGGYWVYSRGAYEGTPLEAMLPASFPAENRIPYHAAGLPLVAAKDSDWDMAYRFGDNPSAFFVQDLVPKPGAAVQLRAGDEPAVITGTSGKGRVVAVALTPNGTPPDGVLAFWDWPDWPRILGQAIDWAAGARPMPVSAASGDERTALTEEEITSLSLGLSVGPDTVRRACTYPTADVAAALLDAALADSDSPICTLPEIAHAIVPFARPEWAEGLREFTDSMNPDRDQRMAAFVLLGASRSPDDYGLLLAALDDAEMQLAAMEALGLHGSRDAVPRLEAAFDQAMAAAAEAGVDGRPGPESFAREYAHIAAHSALALYRLGDEAAVERLAALYSQIHLYRRIFVNAGKRRTRSTDVQGMAILKAIWQQGGKLRETRDMLRAQAGPIPAAQWDAFVVWARAATDPVAIEWAVAAMEQSADTRVRGDWAALHDASDGIIGRLARAISGQAWE